jgi:hypothetical protein
VNKQGGILGALQIVVGFVLTAFVPPLGLAMMMGGLLSVVGAMLTPSPPRQKTMRDSSTYGIDKFDNPRGSEAHVPVLYGTHRVKPAVIAESVTQTVEGVKHGDVGVLGKQEYRWLGVIGEGEISDVRDVEINDRRAFSPLREGVAVATGNGTKKDFAFPARWIYLGEDESPAVQVWVAGVLRSWAVLSGTAEFTVPTPPAAKTDPLTGKLLPVPKYAPVIRRDNRNDRLLSTKVKVYIRGPGYAEREQPSRTGTYPWSSAKIGSKIKVTFRVRPPTGYVVRIVYSYLGADGMTLIQQADGVTRVLFGKAPTNGQRITATYRTTQFHGIRLAWTRGTLDQSPLPGFTDLEQSRNPRETVLSQNASVLYSTDGREVDNLRVVILAAQGFIRYDDTGGTGHVSAEVRIEYRKTGATAYTVLRSATGGTFTLVGERSSAVRWMIDVRDELERRALTGEAAGIDAFDAFERGAYDLRVTRTTKESTDTQFTRDTLELGSVTEILFEGFSYPGSSLLGVRAVPAEFMSGSSLRISAIVTRAPLYDPRTAGGTRDIGSSANHALAIRDLLTSSEGAAAERFGAGAFFTGADLFGALDSAPGGWQAFADWCDEYVHRPGDDPRLPASATNGERRCRLNLSLDTPAAVLEQVNDIALLGYAFLVLQGSTVRFPLDRDGDPVFEFIDDVEPAAQNCSKFALRYDEWGKTPSHVVGQFWNEALDYERDELPVPVETASRTIPTNERQMDLRGCSRETEAGRLLRHVAAQIGESPFACVWEAHPGAQLVEAGDIVTVRTRVPYSTGSTATVFKARVLVVSAGQDDEGRITVRYTGRVMGSKAYKLSSAAVPASRRVAVAAAATQRSVTALRARVA